MDDRSIFLWADAICIDQKNVKERGHQVAIMRNIYQHASEVFVWLGKDEDGQAEAAAILIKDLAKACHLVNIELLAAVDDLYDRTGKIPSSLSRCDLSSWKALQWLLSREWFCRLWVLQEVAANDKVTVLCGDLSMNWHQVAFAATYTMSYPTQFTDVEKTYALNALLMRHRRGHREWDLLGLLNVARIFSATDRRDVLYAMLGFPAFSKGNVPVVPDYSKSVADIFIEIVFLAINTRGNLDVLSYVCHLTPGALNEDDIPSWAPLWNQNNEVFADTEVAQIRRSRLQARILRCPPCLCSETRLDP